MQATKKSNSDPSTTSCLSLVSLSCLQCECSAICQGKTQPNVTHRVFHHIDITSVAFLILSDLLALGGAQANASSIYRRLPVNPSAHQHQRVIISLLGDTHTGSTLPSPSTPRPVPSFQPIILNSLFPTLLSSCPGFTGGGGGVGGRVGPSAVRLCLRLSSTPSGNGTSGWLCMIRRSEARSRYLGVEVWALFP